MIQKSKKVVALCLVAALLGAVAVVFSGCNLFANKVYGTEAAKILLARERLDADTAGKKVDIFDAILPTVLAADARGDTVQLSANSGLDALASHADVQPNGDTVEWTNFTVYSNLKDSYTQFTDDIDFRAEKFAAMIGKIKSEVGITERWIHSGGRRYMLIVEESREILIEREGELNNLNVGVRYTTDDAKNVYEMYSFWETETESGDVRLLCIPGERYEYMYQHSDGFEDYFIADRSCGFWQMNRFSFGEEHAQYSLSFVKDGLGYSSFFVLEYDDAGRLVPSDEGVNVEVFLPGEERDLFYASTAGNKTYFNVYMSNVQSGVASLGVYGGIDALRYELNDKVTYCTLGMADVRVNLTNGQALNPGDRTGAVTYVNSEVDYSPEYHGDCYYGYMSFEVDETDFDTAYALLLEYFKAKGIVLTADADLLSVAYEHADLLRENYDLTEWYGIQLNSYDALTEAEQLLAAEYAEKVALYERVKDYEALQGWYVVDGSVHFETLTVGANGAPIYANGVITVTDLAATVSGTGLMETGAAYHLQIGLARRDATGAISSVRTVALQANGTLQSSVYESGSLALQQTAQFIVPTALSEGEYIVVLYAATEEGIRVSEMVPVAFFSAEEGTLKSDLMDVIVKRSEDHLFVDYRIKLQEWTTTDLAQNAYTYADIERVLLHGVLTKGYPVADATVQTEGGSALAIDGQYGAGTYRIKFLIPVEGVMTEAYMYCTFQTN